MTAAVDVPVSMDIEDTVDSEGKRLRSAGEHAALVGAPRAAADAAGVHEVIDARTDLFLRHDGLQEGGASGRVGL
jgi:2-methylisocitrate lyase-like PEP mutase family enzyme